MVGSALNSRILESSFSPGKDDSAEEVKNTLSEGSLVGITENNIFLAIPAEGFFPEKTEDVFAKSLEDLEDSRSPSFPGEAVFLEVARDYP